MVRILVTNDDGIDSIGLHVLARAMSEIGDVVVVAPDTEYSGASASIGAMHLLRPELHKAHIEGIDQAWALTGPPALCVLLSLRGAVAGPFDLVVSGINPGANVGRAVYYSGTIGAAVAARNIGLTGVAVSQAVTFGGVEGQAWDDMIAGQIWESAGQVAAVAVTKLAQAPLSQPSVLNLNVPNLPVSEMLGWKQTSVLAEPMKHSAGSVKAEPKVGHKDAYELKLEWAMNSVEYPDDTDVGAVHAGYVSSTWLGPVSASHPEGSQQVDSALDELFS